MDNENAVPAPEAEEIQRDEVEIRRVDALSVGEALALAHSLDYPIGKSTLQRWAKHWSEMGSGSPVKCILVTNRLGVAYRIDRSDFEAWVLEQQANQKSQETPPDLPRHQETSRDTDRPRETRQDPTRPQETSRNSSEADDTSRVRLEELEEENLQLRIDIGVRKELVMRAREEMQQLRQYADGLLRENGALTYRLEQLPPPTLGRITESRNEEETPSDPQQRYDTNTVDTQPANHSHTL